MKTLQTFETFNQSLTTGEMHAVRGGENFLRDNSYKVGNDTVLVHEWEYEGATGSRTTIIDGGGRTVYMSSSYD